MALIVAPADGYDSLVSLDEAAAYMVSFGHAWPDEGVKQEVALRRGTQFILGSYSIDPKHLDPVAKNVKDACCEAAWRAASGALFKDSDGRIMTEQTVDVITTKWAEGQQSGRVKFPVIDSLMRGMTTSGAMNIKLIRA